MDEQTLPVRLRYLSTRFAMPELAGDVRSALNGAADELERLAGALHVPRATAEARQTYLGETLEDFVAPSGHVFAAIVLPNAEALRLTGGREPGPVPGLGAELDALGREFAGEAPPTGRPLVDALEVLAALELHGEQHAPAGTERAARGGTHAGGLRAAAAIVRSLAGLDGDAPLHELGAELVSDAGVPAPMPRARAFVAYYAEGWPLPGPGSFVQAGPIGSPWRVLSADRVEAGGGEVVSTFTDPGGAVRWPVRLVLEAVDVHDVPMTARAEVVPLPMEELGEVSS